MSLADDPTPQLGGPLDPNDNYIGWDKGADLTAASQTIIGTDGNTFDVVGTTTIDSFSVTRDRIFTLQFDDELTLKHNPPSIRVPGGADIKTAAGDVGIFFARDNDMVRCMSYAKADGTPVNLGGASVPLDTVLGFGRQNSGPTGLTIRTGTENILRVVTQGNDSAQFSNGAVSAWAFNSLGAIHIPDDGVYELTFTDPDVMFDQANVMLISSNVVKTAGLVGFRINAGSQGEIFPLAVSNIEVSTTTGIPTGTTGPNGRLNIYVNKARQSLFFENRRGGGAHLSITFFASGSGMKK